MRHFQHGKYAWSIERQGKKIQLRWGIAGGKQQTKMRTLANEHVARALYQELIQEKRNAGYTEIPPEVQPLEATGQALESAVVDDPDDLSAHMALADWLSEQSEPRLQARGEFIRVQLTLEDEKLSQEQRKQLRKRERELMRRHERDWLGPVVADLFLDGSGPFLLDTFYTEPEKYRGYRRGWIDWLHLPDMDSEAAQKLANAPCLRLVRRLVLEDAMSGDDLFLILARGTALRNVCVLDLVDCFDAFKPEAFVASLPRLEALTVSIGDFDPGKLFALRSLTGLRVLEVGHASRYPLAILAKNPALGQLTHLRLMPDLVAEWEDPLIRLAGVRALLRSPHLKALTHLTILRSDMGDRGVTEIVQSGILKQLEELDISCGLITDAGARILAQEADYSHLRKLNISENRLTEAGIALLRRPGLKLEAGYQNEPDEEGYYDDSQLYLADEDWE